MSARDNRKLRTKNNNVRSLGISILCLFFLVFKRTIYVDIVVKTNNTLLTLCLYKNYIQQTARKTGPNMHNYYEYNENVYG